MNSLPVVQIAVLSCTPQPGELSEVVIYQLKRVKNNDIERIIIFTGHVGIYSGTKTNLRNQS